MKRVLPVLLALWGISVPMSAQVTLIVTVPEGTPEGSVLHLASEKSNWEPGSESFQLSKAGEREYRIELTSDRFPREYKITRGSWETVEAQPDGGFYPNRLWPEEPEAIIRIAVQVWQDQLGPTEVLHTANKLVQVWQEEFWMPNLGRKRRVWVCLPPGYDASETRYPVMYMHDGQNLFDVATSYSGEWGIDEWMDSLSRTTDHRVIIVGVDNGGEHRRDEYSCWVGPYYGGGEGDAYLRDLAEVVKPAIDKAFRTLPERENTAVLGSSMGGHISIGAWLRYPEVFSRVGSFSPAYAFSPEVFDDVLTAEARYPTRFYQLAGHQEWPDLVSNVYLMGGLLRGKGGRHVVQTKTVLEGRHHESFWQKEFGEAFLWLMRDLDDTEFDEARLPATLPDLTYDPGVQMVSVRFPENGDENYSLQILDPFDGFISERLLEKSGRIDVSDLANGTYVFLFCGETQSYRRHFVKQAGWNWLQKD